VWFECCRLLLSLRRPATCVLPEVPRRVLGHKKLPHVHSVAFSSCCSTPPSTPLTQRHTRASAPPREQLQSLSRSVAGGSAAGGAAHARFVQSHGHRAAEPTHRLLCREPRRLVSGRGERQEHHALVPQNLDAAHLRVSTPGGPASVSAVAAVRPGASAQTTRRGCMPAPHTRPVP
jgi:hypothetical protein